MEIGLCIVEGGEGVMLSQSMNRRSRKVRISSDLGQMYREAAPVATQLFPVDVSQ